MQQINVCVSWSSLVIKMARWLLEYNFWKQQKFFFLLSCLAWLGCPPTTLSSGKAVGCVCDYSPPVNFEAKNLWTLSPCPYTFYSMLFFFFSIDIYLILWKFSVDEVFDTVSYITFPYSYFGTKFMLGQNILVCSVRKCSKSM
jgi:hypothetical protein